MVESKEMVHSNDVSCLASRLSELELSLISISNFIYCKTLMSAHHLRIRSWNADVGRASCRVVR